VIRLPRFREAFIGYHYFIAAAGGCAYAGLAYWTRQKLVATLDPGTRSSLYVSLAATTGVMLGFGITAVAIFLSLGPGRGLDLLRTQPDYAYVRKILMGAIYSLGIATVGMTLMIVLDSGTKGRRPLEAVAAAIGVLALLRTWALLWFLNRLLRIALKDQASGATTPSA
jgi:hypothetical protein